MKNKKLVFFHDHQITLKNGRLYSSGGLNKKVIERYTSICDYFSLATRSSPDRSIKSLSVVGDSSNINYYAIDNLASFNLLNYYNAYKKISKIINKNDYVIIRLPSLIGYLAAIISISSKSKYLIELVGCPWDSFFNYNLKGKLLAFPLYYLTLHICKKTKYISYVTNNFLQNRYPSTAKNILSCSDVEIYPNIENLVKRQNMIKKLKSNYLLRIGMIGSLDSDYKGFDTAILALNKILSNNSNFKLEIVGSGNSNHIKKMAAYYGIEKHVNFIGPLPHPHGINNWLDGIHVYIQPSRVEGLPRALIEAMSRGCACVGSSVGGIPELLNNQYIHKVNDYNSLAVKIFDLYDIDNLAKSSKICFNTSLKYDRNVLDKISTNFYEKFVN